MKKKIQKKEVAKNYFSDTKAILIVLGLPVVIGLISILVIYGEIGGDIWERIISCLYAGAFFGFLLELPIMGILAVLYAVFSRIRKKHKIYDSRYLSKKWTFLIMIVPTGFLLGSLFNSSPFWSFALIGLSVLYSPLLGFLLLTKRIKWRWFMLLLLIFGSILLYQVYQYITRSSITDIVY